MDEGDGVSVPDNAEVLSELREDNEVSSESEEEVDDRGSMGELGASVDNDRTAAGCGDIVHRYSGGGFYQKKDGYMVVKKHELRSRNYRHC